MSNPKLLITNDGRREPTEAEKFMLYYIEGFITDAQFLHLISAKYTHFSHDFASSLYSLVHYCVMSVEGAKTIVEKFGFDAFEEDHLRFYRYIFTKENDCKKWYKRLLQTWATIDKGIINVIRMWYAALNRDLAYFRMMGYGGNYEHEIPPI